MSDTKSGYEIRANLLSQAEGILLSNIDRENYAIAEMNNYNTTGKFIRSCCKYFKCQWYSDRRKNNNK